MHRRLSYALAAPLFLAVGLALTGCDRRAAQEASVPLEGLLVQGRVVTTTPAVNGCEAARLAARESDSTVSLTLRIRSIYRSGQKCSMIMGRRRISTTLREPVGDRSVVDATTYETVRPQG